MNYLREFLYRPKRSDTSLMARFFRADENLTAVAQELDSFDGRKDPERCASLVNKLRSCQDKLLSICNKMLEEVEPGYSSRLREHRAKFPGKTFFCHFGTFYQFLAFLCHFVTKCWKRSNLDILQD